MLKYWVQLLTTETILKTAFNNSVILNKMLKSSNNWAGFVKKKSLNALGFGYLWINYVMDENYTLIKIKQCIYDQAKKNLLNEIQMSVKYINIL